jgi:acetylornithine deacetylase/succinyl-diaminopimelate desuccinylase family protein
MEASARSTLLQAVEGHREAMVGWTRKLVAIPTENPPGNRYSQAAQNIREHLVEIGFGDASIIGDCVMAFAGEGERTLYFGGHYDVVPAQNAAQFEPQLKGVNLFGRGSADMKGGLAAMTYAAKALCDCAVPLRGRIGLVFVPDEETAGPRGSRDLAARGLLGKNAIGMLTPEPTGDVIWNANRGAITLRVTIKGKSAHVGRQFAGVNAFEQMLLVCQALARLKNEVETRTTSYCIRPDAARRSILMMGGQAEAGKNFNVVPESCSFTIDRRINPEEDFDEEKCCLLAVLEEARAAGIDLQVQILQEGASAGASEDSPLGAALARNVSEVTGREARFEMCPGLLEIRFYAANGIPAFAYGPGMLTVSHGPNEFVTVDRIVECAAVYALTAADVLSV